MVRTTLALALCLTLASGARAETFPELSLSVAVAEVDGARVVDRDWLDRQVARANAVFAPQGLKFRVTGVRTLRGAPAKLENRADRDALGRDLRDGVINVFVVKSLRDIHERDRMRQGVHWRPRTTAPGRHLVVVASYAGVNVLAHELGHFFGNRTHPKKLGNIMSYLPKIGVPTFDAAQGRRVARFARRFLETGELKPAPKKSAP